MSRDLGLIRKRIVDTAYRSGAGHIASSLSMVEILYVLYKFVLTGDDYIILSKGHGALGYYAILCHFGFITEAELSSFCCSNSNFGGHPDRNKIAAVFASTGSLGHGLPISVGLALSLRAQHQNGRVFCIVGDGECHEGTFWESMLLAGHHRLFALHCVVDSNHSLDRALRIPSVAQTSTTLGWDGDIISGHNLGDLREAFVRESERPIMTVAETIKGYGVDFMEGVDEWHHKKMTEEEWLGACTAIERRFSL